MAKDVVNEVPKAAELFDKASEILGYDLLKICVEGPKEKLDSTVVSQPALFVSSLAAVEKLRATQGQVSPAILLGLIGGNLKEAVDGCDVTCGLSLGEYTALTFAGALTFEEGLKLVKLRGEAMQAAADSSDSGMVSVIGLKADQVEELCKEAESRTGESIKIANFLCPGNYTVSGSRSACDVVLEIAKPEFKARMAIKLAVAGAFHTAFMDSAVEALKQALTESTIVSPSIPVISNVDSSPHSDPETIKEILSKQVTSPVLWEQSMKNLIDRGLQRGFELGPGTVVSGIMKRIDKNVPIETVEV